MSADRIDVHTHLVPPFWPRICPFTAATLTDVWGGLVDCR